MLKKLLTKEILLPVLIIVIAFLFYMLIKQIVIKIFKAGSKFSAHKKSVTIMNLILNIIKYIILIIAVLSILSVWGVDTGALLASLGIAGVIAGLALQDILKDFLAGFSIIVDNEYDVGDNIKIGNFRGTVIELGMKNTKVRAYSGEVMTIANRNVTDIINYSTHDAKGIINVAVAYESNVEEVEKVLHEVCERLSEKIPYLKSDVQMVGLEELADSAMLFRIEADCEPLKDFAFKREVNRMIKIVFDEKNIEIPYPKVEVHGEL